MKRIALLLLLAGAAMAASPVTPKRVLAVTVTGVIDPVVATHVGRALEEAKRMDARAVLIRLDTPGGLLDATRTAVSSIINSDIPVIVAVTPRGARATSAGVFFMMAADVAGMAPETHLGAAHPVNVGGGDEKPEKKKSDDRSVMEEKAVSDAAAYIRTLAEERGRNAAWAEKAVRESVSLTASEAVKQKVVDVIADGDDEFLKAASGRKITKNGHSLTIDTEGADIVEFGMSFAEKLLHLLGHPNVAYILLTIGVYGLIYELAAPGIGLGGAAGGICLLLAFFSLQVLPLNAVGIALMGLGVILLVLEMISPSHGLLTVGGLAAFATGSLFMVDTARGLQMPGVSRPLIASTVITSGLFFGVAIRQILKARRSRPKTGAETLVGEIGVAERTLEPEGLVALSGELWTARSSGSAIEKGSRVRVVRLEGNKLVVEKTA